MVLARFLAVVLVGAAALPLLLFSCAGRYRCSTHAAGVQWLIGSAATKNIFVGLGVLDVYVYACV